MLEQIWNQLGIFWQQIEHAPVYTVAQAKAICQQLPGTGVKNLLLTDRKREQFLLVLLQEDKRADLKAISRQTGIKHLTFGSPDELQEQLGLTPGSVSPFGILHDTQNRVQLVIDTELQGKTLLLHPNCNTRTIAMHYDDLLRFITHHDHTVLPLSCPTNQEVNP